MTVVVSNIVNPAYLAPTPSFLFLVEYYLAAS